MRRLVPKLARAGTLAAALALSLTASGAASGAPNFVVIVVDDQHWNGTSVRMDPSRPDSANAFHRTPHLEKLARQGMRFSSAYATPLCRPTQLSLQTGKSPARLQITTNSHTGFGRALSPPLPRLSPWMPAAHPQTTADLGDPRVRQEDSIARRLLEAVPEYRTAHFGKYANLLRGWAFFDRGRRTGDLPPEADPKDMFTLSRGANEFIEKSVRAGRPFFVMLTHHAVKPPVEALPATLARWEQLNLPWPEEHEPRRYSWPSYSAMTEDLDASVGMILQQLEALGIERTTYVIYTSDNGRSGIAPATQAPLRYGKGHLYEGGIRVPLILRGPGIEANTVSRVPVSLTDLFPTITELGGARYPLEEGIDGASLVPLLMNGGELPAGMPALRRPFGEAGELFFHYSWPERHGAAVIDGEYKLLKFYRETGVRLELYNLLEDISETNDLSARMPGKVADLLRKLDRWVEGVDAAIPYEVGAPVELVWNAEDPGPQDDVELAVLRASLGTDRRRSDLNGDGVVDRADLDRRLARLRRTWRSTTKVGYKDRETWFPRRGGPAPELVPIRPARGRLPGQGFRFHGEAGLERMFFHVSDPSRRHDLDDDHSASFEFWLRLTPPARPQMLFETGDRERGLSVTFGDADGDGECDEVRFRAKSADGKAIAVTAELGDSAGTERDFLQVVAVLNDSDVLRYASIYVDGELRGHSPGASGRNGRIDWDGDVGDLFEAGLGLSSGELGGDAGDGDLPLSSAGFVGELACFRYNNQAIDGGAVRHRFRRVSEPGPVSAAELSEPGCGSTRPATRLREPARR